MGAFIVQMQKQVWKIDSKGLCDQLLSSNVHPLYTDPLPLQGYKTTYSIYIVDVRSAFLSSPCTENWGQSHMTGRFVSLRSCNFPAAAPAPASGQRSGSSWPHRRLRLRPGYQDAGCLPARQTAAGRGCGLGEDVTASHCSSGIGEQKWRKQGCIKEKRIIRKGIIIEKRRKQEWGKLCQKSKTKSENMVKLRKTSIALWAHSHLDFVI